MGGCAVNKLIVDMAEGVQLVVLLLSDGHPLFTVELGAYPNGVRLCYVDGFRERLRISDGSERVTALWCGAACFDLPWHELNKVANFLQLPIPLPFEPGQQVPV